ncbi:MAG: Ig-like domain-containing protein [Gemmatimonadota bacterium]|nr:Ig-like domain-containing protein [Gemmatimonadota bacterium]
MRRAALLAAVLAAAVGCSEISSGDGIIALAVAVPTDRALDIGETSQLAAWGLSADGDSVEADITWVAADTTVGVDQTGLVTALFPGNGRVQAQSGSLVSDLVSFTVTATPDTLIVPDPPVLDVAAGVTASEPLLPRLETLNPSVPVAGTAITFRIVEPVFATPDERTVELSGGVLERIVTTGPAGTPSTEVRVLRVLTATQPDSALIEVSAETGGVPVPGSGQRFIVRFN